MEESLVLDRNDRVDQNLGKSAESQQPAPLSIPQRDVGDELCVELIRRERGIVRRCKDLEDAHGVGERALPQILFDVASVTVLIEQEGAGGRGEPAIGARRAG